jgi:hypothetical protein
VLYVSGPLEGKLFFLDHDGGDASIAYRSVASFLKIKARSRGLEWNELQTEYWLAGRGHNFCRKSKRDVQQDVKVKIALELEAEFADDETSPEAVIFAFNLMALEAGGILDFTRRALHDDWFAIREQACSVIVAYQHLECIPDLEGLMQHVTSNVAELAKTTLNKLRRP